MSYFKILQWRGGEGGDALLHAFLICNPHIKSNIEISKTLINKNGRTIIPVIESISDNIKNIANNTNLVNFEKLNNELIKLKLTDNWLLKSHYFNHSCFNDDTILIIPSEKTLSFFFSARYSKIPLRFLANTEEKIKLLIKNKQEFIEFDKNKILEKLKKINLNRPIIFIDDILSRNFSSLENKLQLKINDQGKSFINNWFIKQKELFPEELASFS